MPLPLPTIDELLRGNLAEMRTRLGNVDTSPGSDAFAWSWALTMVEADCYTRARHHLRQISPITADEENLQRHGRIIGMGYLPPTKAEGTATVPGVAGTTIAAGVQFTDPTGALYAVVADVAIATGDTSAEVTLRALIAQLAGNLAAGTVLSLTAPVTGLEGTATVTTAFTGGSDRESVEEFRGRVVRTMANPPFSGNSAHGVQWIESVPGVRRGFVYPGNDGPGTVRLTFQGVRTDGRSARIDATLQDEVQAYFRSQVADVAELNAVCALPVADPVDVEIRVAAKPGYEFDWSGSMSATATVAGTAFQVSALPVGLNETHRVVWAPVSGLGGDNPLQRVATIANISAGPAPYTITLDGAGFGVEFTVGGPHTVYPGGPLNDPANRDTAGKPTDVLTALLKEGGVFDKLTPGDVDPTELVGSVRARFPPVSPDYPTELLRAEINAAVFGTFGVSNVEVVGPGVDVTPLAMRVVVPRRMLVRPM